jgi:hypothetical protein
VVERHGWEAAWELRAGGDPEGAIGASLYEVEEEWLTAVDSRDLNPKPCLLAVPGNAVFRGVCQQLEGEE